MGRKYAYLVLPTVLMPRGGFPSLIRFAELVSSVQVAPVADERSRKIFACFGEGVGDN